MSEIGGDDFSQKIPKGQETLDLRQEKIKGTTTAAPTKTPPQAELAKQVHKELHCKFLRKSIETVENSSFDYCNGHKQSFESATVGSSDYSDICGAHVVEKMKTKFGASGSSGADVQACRVEVLNAVCDLGGKPTYLTEAGEKNGLRAYATDIKSCFCEYVRNCEVAKTGQRHKMFLQRVDDRKDETQKT